MKATIEDRLGMAPVADHLTEHQLAEVEAAQSELENIVAKFGRLSEKQRSRALATASGKTPSEIAKSEGVTPQAVTETLRNAAVRDTVQCLVGTLKMRQKDSADEPKSIIICAVEMLGALLYAKKPFGCDGGHVMVPDNQTRLAAVTKIFDLYSEPKSVNQRPPPPAVEEVAIETATRRVSRRQQALG